jgi:hypothetical protein
MYGCNLYLRNITKEKLGKQGASMYGNDKVLRLQKLEDDESGLRVMRGAVNV